MKLISRRSALLTAMAAIPMISSAGLKYSSIDAYQAHKGRRARSNSIGSMKLEFIQFISNQYHTYAQLRVTNGSSETVRFPGYARNSNSLILIRHGIFVNPGPSTNTLNYFGTQSFVPGDTFIFDVQIADDQGAFEVGFGYEVGAKHVWKIIWSEKIQPETK